MSFLVMPSERETGEIMGGGDWANEYAYKNPSTGKWEYTRSPRTYGPNGNLTYEEWMERERGWKPGTYGPSAADNAYNEWVKKVTPKGTGRMNGIGEFIVGTKPNEATKSEVSGISPASAITETSGVSSSSTIASPVSSSEASEQISSSEENKGTDYSWLTEATEQVIPENKENKKEPSKNKEGEYYTFGITKESSKKDEDEYNWVTDNSNENKVANKPANKINDISNAIRDIGKDAEKENQKLAKANPEAAEKFDIGKKAGKAVSDFEEDYRKVIKKYGKDSSEALKAQAKLSAALQATIAIGEVAIPQAEEFFKKSNVKPGKKSNTTIGNYNYTIENFGEYKTDPSGNNMLRVTIYDSKSGVEYNFEARSNKNNEFSMESIANEKKSIAEMVDKSKKAFGLKTEETIPEAPAPVVPEPKEETAPLVAPVPETPKAPVVPKTKEEVPAKIEEAIKETVDKTPPTEEEKPRTVKEIREEISKIDASTVTNVEEANEAEEKITTLAEEGAKSLHNDFTTIYKNLIDKGIKAKDVYDQPEIAKYSQDVFEFGQDLYEGSSRIEARTDELGLTVDKLNKKYINKHLDEMSWKVGQLDPKNSKSVGSYYSPGSDMNGTSVQPTGVIDLSKEDIKTLERYANGIQSTKDAGLAMMKAGAFNGAKNVKGGEYTEEWKKSAALEKGNFKEGAKEFVKDQGKLTWKDYFAAAVKGTLGTVVTVLGVAVAPANPALGSLLIAAGTASAGKAGLQITTDVVRSKSTNEEMMFGSGEGGKDVFRNIYNRSLEPANIGDPRSVSTYTTACGGTIKIATGFVELFENPVVGVTAIRSGIEDINNAGNGGLRGTLGNGINSLYELGDAFSTLLNRADLRPEALGLTKTLPTFVPNVKDKRIWNGDYTVYEEDTENAVAGPAAASEYGSAESSAESSEEEQEALNSTYSGAKEQAKNSNLATDYNAGMEQEVNEAVSDKRVKGYIVKIYGSEPDFIRNAISKILTAHSEREWK